MSQETAIISSCECLSSQEMSSDASSTFAPASTVDVVDSSGSDSEILLGRRQKPGNNMKKVPDRPKRRVIDDEDDDFEGPGPNKKPSKVEPPPEEERADENVTPAVTPITTKPRLSPCVVVMEKLGENGEIPPKTPLKTPVKTPLRPVRLRKNDPVDVEEETAVPQIGELRISPPGVPPPSTKKESSEKKEDKPPPTPDPPASGKKSKAKVGAVVRRQDSISPPVPASPPTKRRRPLPSRPSDKPKKGKEEKAPSKPEQQKESAAPSVPSLAQAALRLPSPQPILSKPVVPKGPVWNPPGKNGTYSQYRSFSSLLVPYF